MDEARQPADQDGAPVTIEAVRFEHHREALGIGEARPRLSWIVETERQGWRQRAYEIRATDDAGAEIDATGRVESDESVLVDWPFAPLESRDRVTIRVRVWGEDGDASAWSAPATVEAGLLDAGAWTARFVSPDSDDDPAADAPAALLRRSFTVRPGLASARLYASALGVFEAEINGAVVGDHVLDPGWTSYGHRLRYTTFDVTDLLREGPNAIGAMLGDGWYRGRLGFGEGRRNIYGDRTALLAQLELRFADGTTETVATDDLWRSSPGPIVASGLYDGETYDARREQPGWSSPHFDDAGWDGVRPVERDMGTLEAPLGPPVRRTEVVQPVSITTSPSGRTLIDFGQNLVGRLRITVTGPAGATVILRHAEVLEEGELGTRPLRHAEATDRYTLRGEGTETWEPRFTFHGFRYAEVDGWPGELRPDDLSAVVVHSDLERTGWFDCSDELVNRLHENVVWSMRGNFLDIPTDCPQRDERLGWTGDINVFTPTACYLHDVGGFLGSWLRDLAAEQAEDGGVPIVVPSVLGGGGAAAVWGDAAVVVPWVLYERTGDRGVLEAQFDSMRAWVDCVANLAGLGRLWDRGFQFGDWLDPAAPPDRPGAARADRHVVATAAFAHSADLLGQAAAVLGRDGEAERYRALAAEVRAAFAREYVTPAGRVVSDATTAYALAIQYGLLPDAEGRRHAGERLAALVRASGYRISTGFVGTPLVCDALCAVGDYASAYRLLLERGCPSWLYPVTMGATTIWERWDSMLPDGTINPGEMTSFNHYALGAVADWLHRTVAGLAPATPGYRQIEVRPRPGGGLTHASARHRTPYGIAESAWSIAGGQIEVKVTVPPNARATVTLPGSDEAPVEVGSGTHEWRYAWPEAEAVPPTLDSTVGELMLDADAWATVIATMSRSMPGFAVDPAILAGYSDVPMREVLGRMPNGAATADALAEALAAAGSDPVQGVG